MVPVMLNISSLAGNTLTPEGECYQLGTVQVSQSSLALSGARGSLKGFFSSLHGGADGLRSVNPRCTAPSGSGLLHPELLGRPGLSDVQTQTGRHAADYCSAIVW